MNTLNTMKKGTITVDEETNGITTVSQATLIDEIELANRDKEASGFSVEYFFKQACGSCGKVYKTNEAISIPEENLICSGCDTPLITYDPTVGAPVIPERLHEVIEDEEKV